MSTFHITFEEFKKGAKEINDAIPTLTEEGLENAWKCLGLMYLGMHEEMWRHSAASVLRIMAVPYNKRLLELRKTK